MAKLIVEKVNTDSREVIGKTCDSSTFSGDVGSREKIKGQTYLTTEDVDDNMTVRGDGNDNLIRKVEKAEKIEVAIQLLNAETIAEGKSLATAILRNVYTSPAKENDGMVEVFVKAGSNCDQLNEILSIAAKLARTELGDRGNGKWYPINKADGKRIIIRLFGEVDSKGKIVRD